MILLDHNIPEQQVEVLRRARLRPQQIGHDVGRPEWQDLEEILRYLRSLKAGTFVTRDEGFFRRSLCHPNYCVVERAGPGRSYRYGYRRCIQNRFPFFQGNRLTVLQNLPFYPRGTEAFGSCFAVVSFTVSAGRRPALATPQASLRAELALGRRV